MKTIAVCQARISSTRLRGKVLKRLGPLTTLDYVVQAAAAAKAVDEVWVATTDNPADDMIVNHCLIKGYFCFRGSEDDVIARYLGLARHTRADILVRLTADCPFLDSSVIAEVIQLRKMTHAHYASNIDPASYPDGLDCEVFTVDALHVADLNTHRPSDRDCVTTFIRNNKSLFNTENLTCPLPGLEKERWVLDSPEDLTFCEELACLIKHWPASYIEILQILDERPELRKINGHLTRNERYYEGMATEDLGARSYNRSKIALSVARETIPLGAQTFSKSYLQYPKEAPLFVTHGDGGYVYDADGNDYVDLVGGLLPVILGYRDPDVDLAIRRQLTRGISFSLSTELEARLAERLCRLIPCAEMVRFGKSGTDVTTAAVRLARAYTNRAKILICGGYHGWNDWAVLGTARDKGVPWNGYEIHRHSFGQEIVGGKRDRSLDEFAAIIVEPETNPQYLEYLRGLCNRDGVVLIFDEVITGFRYGLGGAQEFYGVTPDLACFGKSMANGMPISAVVGRRDIMKLCEPPDNIFYSGTFFGETLSIAAAIATIDKLERLDVPGRLADAGANLNAKVNLMIAQHNLEDAIKFTGPSRLTRLKFGDEQIKTLFIQEMIRMGVLIIASHNLCYAHGKSEIARVLKAYKHTLGVIRNAIDRDDIEERIGGEAIAKFAAVR
jgi:glutamate-1-semialdehyde aminotransferase/spore coat polysaccharide biosynthesis protein SpsF (cytidylyltransferase family)